MKMNLSVALAVLCAIHFASAITDELRKKANEAQAECKKEVGLTDEEYQKYVSRSELPTTEGGKCCRVCACFMTKIGYMTDGKLNQANMKRINAQKWDNPSFVEKANEVDDYCVKHVNTDGKAECEIALEFKTCKTNKIKEIGDLPPPS